MDLISQTKEFIKIHEHNVPDKLLPSELGLNSWELYHWIITKSKLHWLKIQGMPIPHSDMLAEAKNLRHRFVNHRADNGTGWYSLCIHGISSEKTNSANTYGYTDATAPYCWTEIANQCPITRNYFQNCFYYLKYLRIRFMLLEPGGYIEPHHDSIDYKLGPINISLNNPNNCKLVSEGGTVPYEPGSAIFFNTSYRHAALNDSNEDRYHIIVHGQPDGNFWKDIVNKSFYS